MRRFWKTTILAVAAATSAVGCVNGPNDRCYINDVRYHEARRAFERTQSIDVVRQGLKDAHWQPCAINEAIYRIEKEFGLNDSLPSPARIRTEAELMAEQKNDQALVGNISGSLKY